MLRRIRRLRKNTGGAAVLETALVFPILLLFVLGIMEAGRAYWIWDSMRLAVDEAGRYAMVRPAATDAQIAQVGYNNLYGLDPNQFNITSRSQVNGGVNYKLITATYQFRAIAAGILPPSMGNIRLTRQTSVPVL